MHGKDIQDQRRILCKVPEVHRDFKKLNPNNHLVSVTIIYSPVLWAFLPWAKDYSSEANGSIFWVDCLNDDKTELKQKEH